MNSLEDNKYGRWYSMIIEKRLNNVPLDYSESHHIIPKSLGGSDSCENIVRLTAREHFLCHALLAKYYKPKSYPWYKMNHAFLMMKCSSNTQNRYFNSKIYEKFRTNFSEVMSKSQKGKHNSQYRSFWVCNIAEKKNKKIFVGDSIPNGWVVGRNMWNKKVKDMKCCRNCKVSLENKRSNAIFCSKKCKNRYEFITAKNVVVEKNGKIKRIKQTDINSYSKIGWKRVCYNNEI